MLNLRVPRMLPNLTDLVPLLRVRIQNTHQHILSIFGQKLRHFELPCSYLLVKVGSIGVFEGKVAANKGIQNHPATPDVHLRAEIPFPSDHLGGCIARRSTCSFQSFTLFVSITQTKIYNFDCFIIGQK